MAISLLVEAVLADGRKVIRALIDNGIPIDVAFWLYSAEYDRWRLVISSPAFPDGSVVEAYLNVGSVLRKLGDELSISLENITIARPADPFIQAMQSTAKTGAQKRDMQLSYSMVDGSFVDKAYVYRLP